MNRDGFHLGRIALLVGAGILGFLLGRLRNGEASKVEVLPLNAKEEKMKMPVEKRVAAIDLPSMEPVPAELKSPTRLVRLQMVTDLNHLLRSKISVPMFSGEEINPDFVALFGLTTGDVKILNDAIAHAKAQLAELESSHARIEPKGSGKFTVTIPIFPKEGGLVSDEFMKTVRSTIGEDRFAYFNDILSPNVESSWTFKMFGLSQTVINIEELRDDRGMPTANSGMHFDPESGGMSTTVNTGMDFLKIQYPVIYQKMVAAGLIPPSPNK